MTKPDDHAAIWMLGEMWGAPPDVSASLTDEENLDYMKALFCAANGDGRITDAEREWILGYAIAAGNCETNCDALREFDGDGTQSAGMREKRRSAKGARAFAAPARGASMDHVRDGAR